MSYTTHVRRLALAAALLFVGLASRPAFSQIVSVDAGFLHTEVFTHPMFEVYAAAPKVALVRPYAIVSWSVNPSPLEVDDDGKPTVVTQFAVDTFRRGPVSNNVAAGATWYPFLDYKPRFSASTYLNAALPVKNLSAFGLLSYVPAEESWSVLGGLSYTLLFKK